MTWFEVCQELAEKLREYKRIEAELKRQRKDIRVFLLRHGYRGTNRKMPWRPINHNGKLS